MSRYIAWLLAALLALGVIAAGCGDDDDERADDGGGAAQTTDGKLTPGEEFTGVFIPKQTGIAVFDQANEGAKEAAGELEGEEAEYLGPASADACVNGHGLGMFLSYQTASYRRERKLAYVLEEFETEPVPVQVVYAQSRLVSGTVRAFVDQCVSGLRKARFD